MAGTFLNVRFHATEKQDEDLRNVGTRPLTLRGVGRPRALNEKETSFNNDEVAARHYLNRIFQRDSRPAVRGLTAPNRPEVVPDLRFLESQPVPLTGSSIVRFDQTRSSIPIFGSLIVVELDKDRELISMDAELTQVKGVSPVASISPAQALESIAKLAGVKTDALQNMQRPVLPPALNFYNDEKTDSWHLVYFFKSVPAAPPEFLQSLAKEQHGGGHRLGPSPRDVFPKLNYLVDAHDAKVVFYYSATPLLDVPVKLKGIDELKKACEFWGRVGAGGGYELSDPMRSIQTYDFQLSDLENTQLPNTPVHDGNYEFGDRNTAAVSAHVNATRVYDFYKSVLLRDGIDNKGMDLISVVNCTFPREEAAPEWHNAVWWDNRMSYGQIKNNGKFESYARYLDVIAHELTHGITQFTSDLVYDSQSGALNESFSDIFGVVIKNWYEVGADSSPQTWNWELGSGLGGNGLPLRDMSNPKRTGDPDHMNDYLNTNDDSGGVHTNSNIHNKAAYNVFTAVDADQKPIFSAREAAVLYYLCLTRLNSRATFSKVLQTLIDVASTYFPDPVEREAKLKAIKEAYGQTGIS